MTMEHEEGYRPGLRHPYLQILAEAGLGADQIIVQAQALGMDPDALRVVASQLHSTPWTAASPAVGLALRRGAARDPRPYVAEGRALGLGQLEPLLRDGCGELDGLTRLLEADAWEPFRRKVLRRLGYPLRLGDRPLAVLPWLERDLGLVQEELTLARFASSATVWRNLVVDTLVLRDGTGPEVLGHPQGGAPMVAALRATRLFRVNRLRDLDGLRHLTCLVAVDCPDLERLDGAPPMLVLKRCPRVSQLPPFGWSVLLHLEDCPGLRSLGSAQVWDYRLDEMAMPSYKTLILSGCTGLRDLPALLHVTGRMLLRRMGPIHVWPTDFHVGGDLLLKDCPAIEELPPLSVTGCLRVQGASGLKRLAPGSVVGGHLDLRACARLEGVPRGVRVGGCLYLPPHLQMAAPAFEPQEPLLDAPVDHYPALHDLLLGLRFAALAGTRERLAVRERAEGVLAALRRELRDEPRLESELLWTAQEVWRDLSEELWAQEHPSWDDRFGVDEDLPLAWVRGLLLAA